MNLLIGLIIWVAIAGYLLPRAFLALVMRGWR